MTNRAIMSLTCTDTEASGRLYVRHVARCGRLNVALSPGSSYGDALVETATAHAQIRRRALDTCPQTTQGPIGSTTYCDGTCRAIRVPMKDLSGLRRPKRPPVVRFWTLIYGSPVRLTLCEGELVQHAEYEQDEEGYCYTFAAWLWVAARVEYSWARRTRDCDGRHADGEDLTCPLGRLEQRRPCDDVADEHPDVTGWPDWQPIT